MTNKIFSGKLTLRLGETLNDSELLENVKEMSFGWKPRPHIIPQTVMNTVNPIGFHQGHKWVEGELKVLSEAYHAFYHNGTGNKAYIVADGDNVIIPYFVTSIKDNNGNTWIATFTNAIVEGQDEPYADGEDTVQTFRFYATKYMITPA